MTDETTPLKETLENNMTHPVKRLGPDDFGYTFVGYTPPEKEEPEEGEAAADNETEEPFLYHPRKKKHHGVGDDGDAPAIILSAIGACCCCLFVALCIAGGVLLSIHAYSGALLAGVIAFVIAAGACACGCATLCVGCVTAVVDGDDHSTTLPKEIKLKLRRWNDRYEYNAEDDLKKLRLDVVGDLKEIKEAEKKERKKKKEEQKKADEELEKHVQKDLEAGVSVEDIKRKYRPTAFYINFDGDIFCSQMELFRKQISVIVKLARPGIDQAVVVVTSPGGTVSQYGLAASQLIRIRKAGVHLVVCIDTVAASGGFMMASVADTINAAPFAVVGSIGVITKIPNFQRFLNRHDIDAYLLTAGRYKRTIDVIGDVTEEGKTKLQEELDDMHGAFKDHVALSRPRLCDNIEDVATGEGWLAVQAKEKGLVDEIMTSDEYVELLVRKQYDIIEILEKKEKKSVLDLFELDGVRMKTVIRDICKAVSAPPQESHTPMAIS